MNTRRDQEHNGMVFITVLVAVIWLFCSAANDIRSKPDPYLDLLVSNTQTLYERMKDSVSQSIVEWIITTATDRIEIKAFFEI